MCVNMQLRCLLTCFRNIRIKIISTGSAAEELVYARIGPIPSAGNLAAHTG
jgi:hypothetical protein